MTACPSVMECSSVRNGSLLGAEKFVKIIKNMMHWLWPFDLSSLIDTGATQLENMLMLVYNAEDVCFDKKLMVRLAVFFFFSQCEFSFGWGCYCTHPNEVWQTDIWSIPSWGQPGSLPLPHAPLGCRGSPWPATTTTTSTPPFSVS